MASRRSLRVLPLAALLVGALASSSCGWGNCPAWVSFANGSYELVAHSADGSIPDGGEAPSGSLTMDRAGGVIEFTLDGKAYRIEFERHLPDNWLIFDGG